MGRLKAQREAYNTLYETIHIVGAENRLNVESSKGGL